MSTLPMIARLLLGLIFTVFGLNGFFQFMPAPELPEAAQSFLGALVDTGYMMTMVKIVEVVCGVLLLVGRFVPLALALLAPNIVNIVLFHVFLAPGVAAMAVPVLVLVLELYLAWAYRDSFRAMLDPNAKPVPPL